MKVSVEDRSSTEKKIDVVISAETVRLEREGIVRKLQRNAKVDGFRQGKVPEAEIEKLFAGEIKEELVSNLVTNSFQDALKEVSASPVSRPAITPNDLDLEKEFSYSAVFDVLPAFELPVYKGLGLKQAPISVSAQDVEQALEQIVEGSATVEPVKEKRPCAAEDVVEVDYRGTIDGKTIEGLEKSGVRFLLGKGRLLEDFEKNITGMSDGEEKEFEIAYPEDFQIKEAAGKSVKFTLKVTQVFDRKVPAVDDEFAKKLGSDNVAGLKSNVEKDLTARLEAMRDASLDEQICAKLGDVAKFDVPARLVADERERLEAEMKRDFEGRGIDVPPIDEKASESLNKRAGENVKLSLIISRIAEAESIEANENDLTERFSAIASQTGVSNEQIREYYEKNSLLNGLNSQIVSAKVMKLMRENAEIKTEDPPKTPESNPES
ncbi:MAG: trigger factor [Candidatus Mycalebacterium zealandia]|nr:MAG: trigger factor [Candidatus Mycalebacterium zealandia]